jgi:hypothetical protein
LSALNDGESYYAARWGVPLRVNLEVALSQTRSRIHRKQLQKNAKY